MTGNPQTWAIIGEALASAWSQKVASIVTVIMVGGMCATVLLTTGRSVGAEQNVLGTIDACGTTSIVVNAEQGAGLDTGILARLQTIGGISWFAAFGPAEDVTNVRIRSAPNVSMRFADGRT